MKKEVFTQEFEKCFTVFQQVQLMKKYIDELLENEHTPVDISGKVDKTTTFTDPNGNPYEGETGWVVYDDKLFYETKIRPTQSGVYDYSAYFYVGEEDIFLDNSHITLVMEDKVFYVNCEVDEGYSIDGIVENNGQSSVAITAGNNTLKVTSDNGLLYNDVNLPTINEILKKVIDKTSTSATTIGDLINNYNITYEWFLLDIRSVFTGTFLIFFEPHGPNNSGIKLFDLNKGVARFYPNISNSDTISVLKDDLYNDYSSFDNFITKKFNDINGYIGVSSHSEYELTPGIYTAYAPGYSSGCVMFAVYKSEVQLQYYITYQANPGEPITQELIIVRTTADMNTCSIFNNTSVTLNITKVL